MGLERRACQTAEKCLGLVRGGYMSDDAEVRSAVELLRIRAAIERCLSPGHFFVHPSRRLRIVEQGPETIPWEIYLGHLLDASLTRRSEQFYSWHCYLDAVDPSTQSAVPLVSLRWQSATRQLLVTRNILTHAHEAYESSPGVIETRPATKWSSELVGWAEANDSSPATLVEDLERLVLFALVGISRLPITSLESPATEYSLGLIGYFPNAQASTEPATNPLKFLRRALTADISRFARVKALDTALRAMPGDANSIGTSDDLAQVLLDAGGADETYRLLIAIFNGVALSPYTGFAERLVALVESLSGQEAFGQDRAGKLVGLMLRQLCRHLTAFDLTLFHNFGANYPDALFLDSLLKAFLRLLERPNSNLAETVLARRALRQSYLMRRHYEGQRVPDAPTSMGENTRVLPPPFERVPEEQIMDVGRRRKTLFDGDPTDGLLSTRGRELFTASVDDLQRPEELAELGMAIYLDRPLGALKQPGEVDRTPLVSCEAFSRSIAVRRLAALKSAGLLDRIKYNALNEVLRALPLAGVRACELSVVERPGVVSLADANKAAMDFVLLRTLRTSLRPIMIEYDLRPLEDLFPQVADWIVGSEQILLLSRRDSAMARPELLFFNNSELHLKLGLPERAAPMNVYRQRAGVELPRRLQVLAAKGPADEMVDVSGQDIWIELRSKS